MKVTNEQQGNGMSNRLLSGMAGLTILSLSAPANAELVNATDPAVIAQIARTEGLPARLKYPDDFPVYIESKYNGLDFIVFFLNCDDENRNCKTIQFYMGYSDAKGTTLERLNEWNRDRRFARAYRDDEGDPVLEMDVDLDFEGIPRANLAESFRTWQELMDAFQAHIFE